MLQRRLSFDRPEFRKIQFIRRKICIGMPHDFAKLVYRRFFGRHPERGLCIGSRRFKLPAGKRLMGLAGQAGEPRGNCLARLRGALKLFQSLSRALTVILIPAVRYRKVSIDRRWELVKLFERERF